MADDPHLTEPAAPPRQGGRCWREPAIAVALLSCVVLVAFWEIMANRSRRPFTPFALTSESCAQFSPTSPEWSVQILPIAFDPVEPNILALLVQTRPAGAHAPVLVRLVHGYNMVDCMRIKGERVELIADTREAAGAGGPPGAPPAAASRAPTPAASLPPGVQLWRLASPTDRISIWATTMLRAGTFAVTGVDTREMAFPRVDIPDNPGWFPQGLTWRSLRHPIANGRLFLRAKWNASRADVLTFLGLRQPAWASEELLTLVATSTDSTVTSAGEDAVASRVVAAHQFVRHELQGWWTQRVE